MFIPSFYCLPLICHLFSSFILHSFLPLFLSLLFSSFIYSFVSFSVCFMFLSFLLPSCSYLFPSNCVAMLRMLDSVQRRV
jgi:hypothetical protein